MGRTTEQATQKTDLVVKLHGATRRPTAAVAVVLVVALFLAGILIPGCGGDDEGDPQAILSQASAAMREIKGFHFVYETQKPSSSQPTTGMEIGRITGDVNNEGSMQADVDITQGGLPLSIQLVVVGNMQYFNFTPGSPNWQQVAVAKSPVGELNLATGTVRILDQITDASYEGRDKKEGVNTHHIKGQMAAGDVETIAGAVSTTDPFSAELWIGVDDGYVYEVRLTGAATASEPKDMQRTITLSHLNIYVDIKAPH